MIIIFIGILAAYLIGSIPTAFIFGKVLKGIDIREFGSGNVGATNVARTIGKFPGIIVFVLDVLKGFVSVALIPVLLKKILPETFEYNLYMTIMMGAAAIAGHIWTCFLGFKGGKGVSTTAGAVAGLAPEIFILVLIVWIITFSIWKYVSLASIIAALSLPIISVIAGKPIQFTVFTGILSIVGVIAHKSNIKRLILGTETRIVKAKKS